MNIKLKNYLGFSRTKVMRIKYTQVYNNIYLLIMKTIYQYLKVYENYPEIDVGYICRTEIFQ